MSSIAAYINIINNSSYDLVLVQNDSSNNGPALVVANTQAQQFSESSDWTDIVSTMIYKLKTDTNVQVKFYWCVGIFTPDSASSSVAPDSSVVSVSNTDPSGYHPTITFTVSNP